jgi:nitrite reductase/ring-hydroxylating ferredoxin subunit
MPQPEPDTLTWMGTGIAEDAEADEIHGAQVAGGDVALVRTDGRWYAVNDWCSHAECAFSDYGELDGTTIICNCHGAEFDLRTGEVLQDPATEPLDVLPVRCRDGRVEVGIDPLRGENAT